VRQNRKIPDNEVPPIGVDYARGGAERKKKTTTEKEGKEKKILPNESKRAKATSLDVR